MIMKAWSALRTSVAENVEAGVSRKNDRILGLLLSGVLGVIVARAYLVEGRFNSTLCMLIGTLLLISAFAPILMRPISIAWFTLAGVLHFVMNPLILGVIFFAVFTPFGLVKRVCSRKKNAGSKSYWIQREPPGPEPAQLKHQF
jgi:RsiW-degrading membrane proteinase PrsW (M82 family)